MAKIKADWWKTSFGESYIKQQEISKLARKAGFKALKFFGDYESHPYKKDSPRLILVAKKK